MALGMQVHKRQRCGAEFSHAEKNGDSDVNDKPCSDSHPDFMGA